MTCIAGIATQTGVWIGGDSAGGNCYSLRIRDDLKVFCKAPFVFGFTTSFRMGQLLRWAFEPPEQDLDMSDEQFMSSVFIDGVRDCLKMGGFAKKKDEGESGGTFLVGYKNKLYQIEDDYQVGRTSGGIDAIGSGQDIALGALAVTPQLPPEARIRLALSAAERFCTGVRGPFMVVNLELS